MAIKLLNYLEIFKDKQIFIGGCENILRQYRKQIRSISKKSISNYYLSGKSNIPVDLIFRIAENNTEILEKCFENVKIFSPRSYKGHKLPKIVTKQLAYLIGSLRDGTINDRTYSIVISQKGQEGKKWLLYLRKIIKQEFDINPKIMKFKNNFIIQINSKVLFIFLNKIFEMSTNQSDWETPKIIKQNKELWIPYISGFFDAEGYCTKTRTFQKTGKIKISFHQNNFESLKFIKNVLNLMDIPTGKIYLQKGRKCYALYIQSKNGILKFYNIFNLFRKRDNLKNLVLEI